MFADWPFLILLLTLSALLLGFKAATRHIPTLALPWWGYRHTMLLLGSACCVIIYQDDWRWPVAAFVVDYGLFLLARRGAIPRWLGVVLTLAPLITVKAGALPFVALLGLSFITFRAIDALLMSDPKDPDDLGEYFLYLFYPPA